MLPAGGIFYRFFNLKFTAKSLIFIAMVLMTAVSIWTTYISLYDSILPGPTLPISLFSGVWQASIPALGLSLAIGLMLFGLKLSIMFEDKRLNGLGLVGMLVVAFISISFNMDVLYRTADKEFYLRHSDEQMRGVYQQYIADVQRTMAQSRETFLVELATQKAELESEVEGLRAAPAGFGPRAKKEAYRLKKLEAISSITLKNNESALVAKQRTDELLSSAPANSLAEVMKLQTKIRVAVKDIGIDSGIALPNAVKMESPLFAVIGRLFDWGKIGIKEIFFLVIALFLDLGDIIGYSLVPNRRRKQADNEPDANVSTTAKEIDAHTATPVHIAQSASA